MAYRRSDLIESLHDGSWFHDRAKLWVFLPTAAVVLMLWGTGIYLFFLPLAVRWPPPPAADRPPVEPEAQSRRPRQRRRQTLLFLLSVFCRICVLCVHLKLIPSGRYL